jgi:uncharacterized protein (TIGR01777 family)
MGLHACFTPLEGTEKEKHPMSTDSTKTILVTGATGLVGQAVTDALLKQGHRVYAILRPSSKADRLTAGVIPLYMDLLNYKETDVARLEAIGTIDGVIHLAGESILGLWTTAKRERIYASRVDLTRKLGELLCALEHPPNVFISASAVGIYGIQNGDAILKENAHYGDDFLAQVCQDWESASDLLKHAGIRTVQARFGVILSGKGGALKAMLPAFKLGLGGILGDGSQWMSWVHLDDVVGVLLHALHNEDVQGAYNVTAPSPICNKDFTAQLGEGLHRPTPFPVPAFLLKYGTQGMGESLLLASQRCSSDRIMEAGYAFAFTDLASALRDLTPTN